MLTISIDEAIVATVTFNDTTKRFTVFTWDADEQATGLYGVIGNFPTHPLASFRAILAGQAFSVPTQAFIKEDSPWI